MPGLTDKIKTKIDLERLLDEARKALRLSKGLPSGDVKVISLSDDHSVLLVDFHPLCNLADAPMLLSALCVFVDYEPWIGDGELKERLVASEVEKDYLKRKLVESEENQDREFEQLGRERIDRERKLLEVNGEVSELTVERDKLVRALEKAEEERDAALEELSSVEDDSGRFVVEDWVAGARATLG